jgi:DNA-directed RNA polymerase I, II, and III subunit RPABC1
MNTTVRLTVREMLRDRGYTEIDEESHDRIVARNDNSEKVLVYFVYDVKVSVKRMKTIKDIIDEDTNKYMCLVLVYKSSITTFAKQFISTDVNDLNVQVFSENELSFNITKHELVPKHEVLTPIQKKAVMTQYKTVAKHFPMVLSSDPVVRYYGALPGTMMRITRKSPTAGEYVLYRVVV